MQYFEKAEIFFKQQDYVKAKEFYSNCIETTRLSSEGNEDRVLISKAYNNRGQAEYLCVNFIEAISDYSKALEFDPKFSVALYNRGLIHYRLGRYSAAVSDFNKAIEYNPDFADAKIALKTAEKERSIDGDRI